MGIPREAEEVCARYMAAMEQHAPGLLAGLYLVGSIALDDYRAGRSDIDFVALVSRPADYRAVATVHTALGATRPVFDGIYVTEGDLAAPAANAPPGLSVVDGRVYRASTAERHAVTWITLARHGVTVMGADARSLAIHTDIDAAILHARNNLRDYWQHWLHRHAALLSVSGLAALTPAATVWAVLGVSRLHATITHGVLLSKSAAARYARDVFPEHKAIISHALLLRAGAASNFPGGPLARRRAMLAFVEHAIAHGLA
jgi:hypothetical protein